MQRFTEYVFVDSARSICAHLLVIEALLLIKAAGISHVHVVAIMPARVLVTTTSTMNVRTPNCDRSPSSPDMNGEPPNAKRRYPKKKMMKE